MCKLVESLLCGEGEATKIDWKLEASKLHPFVCTVFVFSYVWGMGGNLAEKSVDKFDMFVRDLFSENHDVKVCVCVCVCTLLSLLIARTKSLSKTLDVLN